MTRARAPGKVVLSGAYAVLHGAPAIVSAVSRYVTVDTARPASLVTPEVQAALAPGQSAPWFDASDLREDGRKLGLGSSAAILVASLYALQREAPPPQSEVELKDLILNKALAAHRQAQGGGSGVDVASSTLGGTLCYRMAGPTSSLQLPRGLVVEVWTCPVSASTRDLLAAVAKLARVSAPAHERIMAEQSSASERAVERARAADAEGFVAALREQERALSALGHAAGVPIVTPELAAASPLAVEEGGVLLPAGAGGGDIALFVGRAPSSPILRAALQNRQHRLLAVELSVAGVSVV
jgi:phosphomevalonate kinase